MCTCVFKEWCISFTVLRVHHLLDPSRTETLRWIPVLGGPVIRVTINYCEHTVLLFANSMFQIHCQVKRFFWILPVCRHEISEFQTVIIILLHDEVCRSSTTKVFHLDLDFKCVVLTNLTTSSDVLEV